MMKVCGHADTVQNHMAIVSPSPQREVERAEPVSALVREGWKTTFFVVRCV